MIYHCTECNGPVKKQPLLKDSAHGLGHWRCSGGCRKRVIKIEKEIWSGKEKDLSGGKPTMRSITVTRDIKIARSR
jgi:hypothetical protein